MYGAILIKGENGSMAPSPPAQHLHQHRPPPLQRPEPGLKILIAPLHLLKNFTNPLYIPVRLVNELPGSLCIGHPGNPPGDSRTAKGKSLTVRIICIKKGRSVARPAVAGWRVVRLVRKPPGLPGLTP